MALTPLKIVALLACTLGLSIVGVLLMIMGVHGSQILTILGAFLLLPSVILTRVGVPMGIPFLSSTKIFPMLLFFVLQAAYYYGLLQVIYFIGRLRRRHSPVS